MTGPAFKVPVGLWGFVTLINSRTGPGQPSQFIDVGLKACLERQPQQLDVAFDRPGRFDVRAVIGVLDYEMVPLLQEGGMDDEQGGRRASSHEYVVGADAVMFCGDDLAQTEVAAMFAVG